MSRKTQRKFSLSIAAVVIAIMAGVYFLQIRQHDEPTEERTSYIVNLITRNEDEVEWIVDFNSQHIIPYFDEIERIQWRFFRFEYRCSPQRMREKVSFAWNLTAVGIAHENSAGINLADFGLDSSANAFQVHYHDEGSHVLHLGSQTSDLQHYFLMIDDDPAIYLINASDGNRMLYDIVDLLDMSVPEINIEEAEFIQIEENGNVTMQLGLRDEDTPPSPLEGFADIGGEQLIMQQPLAGMAISHSRLMESVIQPISELRLLEVANVYATESTELAPYGLDAPSLEFIFRTSQNEIRLLFGETFTRDETDFIYVIIACRPHVFIAEASAIESLRGLTALDIAERYLALISIADVESITIEDRFVMVMNHTRETYDIAPTINGIPVDSAEFRSAYMRIISLLADAQIEPFAPEGSPELTITYHRIDNPDTQIRLFDYNNNFLAVSINGADSIFVTSRRIVIAMLKSIEELVGIT